MLRFILIVNLNKDYIEFCLIKNIIKLIIKTF